MIESKLIPLKDIEVNRGQIEGLPSNPRFIKDEKFRKLMASIEENPEMLQLRELLVFPHDGKYVIVGGNMRYKALRALKYTEAPCKIIPPDTDVEKLRAYTIKDNGDFGEWDFELLANEWDATQLGEWGVEIPEAEIDTEEEHVEEDDFDEDEDEITPICKPGDIWQLGEHRLMCGDSTSEKDIKTLMGEEQADLWLTDPPYNVAIKNSKGMKIQNDDMASAQFREFLTNAFKASNSVMRPGCAGYVWFASREHINFEKALNAAGFQVRQELIWNKNALIIGRQDYQWKHEPCLYFWKEGKTHHFTPERNHSTVIPDASELDFEKMSKAEMKKLLETIYQAKLPTTIIDEKKPTKDSEHPTMKPVKLFGYQMQNSSRRGDIVLDTFGGSGTTMIAAEQLGRKARLMELDPHYCDVIIARWEKMTGQVANKING